MSTYVAKSLANEQAVAAGVMTGSRNSTSSQFVDNRTASIAQLKRQTIADTNTTGLPDHLKSGMENLTGHSMDHVRVHYNSAQPAAVQARAYAQGSDIHLAPGQAHHLPHELGHVVQQMEGRVKATTSIGGTLVNDSAHLEREATTMGEQASQRAPIHAEQVNDVPLKPLNTSYNRSTVLQGYFDKDYLGRTWRQSDDLTLAVRYTYPDSNHQLYAEAGKVQKANAELSAVNSGIELVEKSTLGTFSEGGTAPKRSKKLKKVEAKNKKNKTSGDNMKLYADCGRSNSVVVGGSDRQASYDAPGAANSKASGEPDAMKLAIMKKWLENEKANASNAADRTTIDLHITEGKAKELQLDPIIKEYHAAKTDAERKVVGGKYFAKLSEVAEKYWLYYNGLTDNEKDTIDSTLKINRYANPDVGQGYTISSGGASAGKATWNFHWGGVVMESTDGKDKVVLENYATGNPNEENKLWTFDMYGTHKKGQTFHERHEDTLQHGLTPTTMTIEKK